MFLGYTKPGKHVKREDNMTGTQREDGGWDDLSLELMYNGINYMFGFDASEVGTGKR